MAKKPPDIVTRVRVWLAAKILPPGWGPCITGKANAPYAMGTVALDEEPRND